MCSFETRFNHSSSLLSLSQFDVTNTGSVNGCDVPLMFVTFPEAAGEPVSLPLFSPFLLTSRRRDPESSSLLFPLASSPPRFRANQPRSRSDYSRQASPLDLLAFHLGRRLAGSSSKFPPISPFLEISSSSSSFFYSFSDGSSPMESSTSSFLGTPKTLNFRRLCKIPRLRASSSLYSTSAFLLVA